MPASRPRMALAALALAVNCGPASADPAEDAKQIVSYMVSEEQFVAIMVAGKAKLSSDARTEFGKTFDMSKVSKEDFATFIDIFISEMAAGTVAGLRVAFEKKLVTELTENDLKIMLKCMQRKGCEANKYTSNGLKTISGLSKFGEEAGGRIGTSVGLAINPRLIEIAKANRNNRFKNPQSIVEMLSASMPPQ